MEAFTRLFSTANGKGNRNYINSQKKFELLRTFVSFALPLGLFIIGYVTTKTKVNLLTIIAVVGCLPASKSLVGAIMFLRYKSCPAAQADKIDDTIGELMGLYDMVFTSYQKNYVVNHMVIHGNTICGYSEQEDFPEKEFQLHIENILKMDGHKNYTVKIFTNIQKYTDRLIQLNQLDADNKNVSAVISTLKSVAL